MPTNRTLNFIMPQLQTVRFSDTSKAIDCIDGCAENVDCALMIGECSMVASITENLVHSTAEYFLVRPMVAAGVLREDKQSVFIARARYIYNDLHKHEIIHTSAYLKAGLNSETTKVPYRLLIGALLYSCRVC